MRKLFSANEVEAVAVKEYVCLDSGHNHADTVAEVLKKAKEQASFYSMYHHTEARFSMAAQDSQGNKYLGFPQYVLQTPVEMNLTIRFDSYRKKYYIGTDLRQVFPNVDHYTIEQCKEGIKEPQQIGVLNTKKVTQWVNYWLEVYALVKEKDAANGSKKAEFIKSLEGLPVKWFGDEQTSGEVVLNGLILTFQISETFVSQKIELYYKTPNTVASFKALTANNYKPATD